MNKTIEEAAKEFADREYEIGQVDWDALYKGYYHGMKDALGKQEKDAEGEEMLTVSRKDAQKIYKESRHIVSNEVYGSKIYSMHLQIMCVLENLFGPKCLPDESESPILSKVENIGKDCKAEPKFKVGDEVVFEESVHIVVGVLPNLRLYYLSGCEDAVAESDLEPYTEPLSQNPTENCDNENRISNSRNLSQDSANCDKLPNRDLCDKLIQRGFKNHNRLHLASIIMAGLLASDKDKHPVKRALELADALISETKKGSEQ